MVWLSRDNQPTDMCPRHRSTDRHKPGDQGMVSLTTIVDNEAMAQDHGWFSYTGGTDSSHLTKKQRQVVEERTLSRGRLLGVVQVRVYENGCEPFVTFPQGAVLGIETDQSTIAEMVARARDGLLNWR